MAADPFLADSQIRYYDEWRQTKMALLVDQTVSKSVMTNFPFKPKVIVNVNFPHDHPTLREANQFEMNRWARSTLKGKMFRRTLGGFGTKRIYFFESVEDATIFKLRWLG